MENLKEKNSIKEKIRNFCKYLIYGFLIVLTLSLNYYGGKFLIYINSNNTETKCGVVTSGFEKNRNYKSQTYRDLYMGVKYDDGTFEALEVSPTTYLSKTVGDRVCFETKTKYEKNWLEEGLSIFGMGLVVMEVFALLILFIRWAFNIQDDENDL